MPDLKHMTEQLRPHLAENANYPKILKLDFKGEGVLRVEGIRVDNEDGPADCTILVALADFEAISKGEIDPAGPGRERETCLKT